MKLKRNLTWNYALIHLFIWAEYGFLFSYANQYLTEHLHLTDTVAGLVLGLATAAAFALQPPLTTLAERTDARRVLALSAAASAVFAFLTLLPVGSTATLLFFALTTVALQVMPSFANAIGMSGIRCGQTINFGIGRGVGSICFGMGARLAAPLIAWLGRQAIPLSGGLMALGVMVATLLFPALSAATISEEKPDSARVFFRKNRRFALLLVGIVLLYVGHNTLCNCMFRIAQSKLPDATIDEATSLQGTALLIAALVELPVMFFFTKMVRRVRCDIWLVISGIFMTLRLALTLLLPGAWGLCVAQLAQIMGFSLIAVCAVYYVGTIIDRRNVVKGQTYLGTANTLGCVLAYLLGGVLIDAVGVNRMLLIATLVSVVGAGLTFVARQRVTQTAGT